MHKLTLLACSVLLGISISGAQSDWETAVEEIREELQKSVEEIQQLKERLREDGLPAIRGFDAIGIQDRAFLGVVLRQGNDHRLMIAGFAPQSNARDSGVQEGDVLIAIDAQDLTGDFATNSAVIEYLKTIEPGVEVILTVIRGDAELQFTVETHSPSVMFGWLDRRSFDRQVLPHLEYRQERADRNDGWLDRIPWGNKNVPRVDESDVEVTDLDPDLGSYFGVESGVLVLKAGEKSALKAGDVIVAVGDQDVASSRELHETLKDASGSVTVQRDGKTLELTIDEALEGLRLEREVRIFSSQSRRPPNRQIW